MTGPDIKNGSGEIVITFKGLHLQDRVMGPLPSGYMGFTWSDSAWVTSKVFSSSVCGGRTGLLNAHGKDITIESKNLFDLKGLSLCAPLGGQDSGKRGRMGERGQKIRHNTDGVEGLNHPMCLGLPRH